ncbi:MAG: hypothetical protein Q9168_006946 [Polycauliona sp. 1 TL-2023]
MADPNQENSTSLPTAETQLQHQNEDNLIKSNRKYTTSFDDGNLSPVPTKKYVLGRSKSRDVVSQGLTSKVTCMDCRFDPATAFGINLGDAHTIRNPGGSAREALRGLVFSNQLLGTNQIFVVKHTKCGISINTNHTITQKIAKNLGEAALAEFDRLEWFPFVDPEQGVKDDVAFLKASKAIPSSINVSGWVYDVDTGKIKSVGK